MRNSGHNPNPFHFVPFAEKPFLFTKDELEQGEELVSGYLEVSMKALTPIHSVGYQERFDKYSKSYQLRRYGQPMISAATLRGAIRSFIEVITSGWVSQVNQEYPKVKDERHVGFEIFENYPNQGRTTTRVSQPALDPDFAPTKRDDNKIDIGTYLFGIVTNDGLALKSRIFFEDIFFEDKCISEQFIMPNIGTKKKEQFMGGGKPSLSNWWYFKPNEIWNRQVKNRNIVEFIGKDIWGRKFYFHQDPEKCTPYYVPERGNWKYSKVNYYPTHMECIIAQSESRPFCIYFNQVSKKLLSLLILTLFPGESLRHKIGYGKAYGYGSFELSLVSAQLRTEELNGNFPDALTENSDDIKAMINGSWEKLKNQYTTSNVGLVDWDALQEISKILSWEPNSTIKYTYPPFDSDNFSTGILWRRFKETLSSSGLTVSNTMKVTLQEGEQISELLFDEKKTIHFMVYQEKSNAWSEISRRRIF